jgi:hypothetical protein
MADWKCIRCGVLCITIPRHDDKICAWRAREVARIGAAYCGECTKYHPGSDCSWEERRIARVRLMGWLCEKSDKKPVLPEDVLTFFRRAGLTRGLKG